MIALVVASAILPLLPFVRTMEAALVDARFRIRGPIEPDAKVAVIAIDDATEQGPWRDIPKAAWPGELAKLVTFAHRSGARVIGVDLVVSVDMDEYLSSKGVESLPVEELALAIAETDGKTFLATFRPGDVIEFLATAEGVSERLASVRAISRIDGAVRAVPREDSTFSPPLPSLAWAMVGGGRDDKPVEINFTDSFPKTVSASDVLAGRADEEHFENAYVLIGETFTGSEDVVTTPFDARAPGLSVHADAIQTLLSGRELRYLPEAIAQGIAVLTAGLFGWLGFRWGVGRYAILAALALAAWLLAAQIIFSQADTVIPLAPVLLVAGLIAPLFVYGLRALEEYREKLWIRSQWGQMIPESFVQRMEANRTNELGAWGQYEASLLFFDIAGFSDLAGRISSEELVRKLNELLSHVIAEIENRGGVVLNFLGDGLAAMWELRLESDPVECREACLEAAFAVLEKVSLLNKEVTADTEPWRIRMGLAYGEVALALIGSDHRKQMTVYGSAVNLASRCEQHGKDIKSSLVATAEFGDLPLSRTKGLRKCSFKPKGWKEPVVVYHLPADPEPEESPSQ